MRSQLHEVGQTSAFFEISKLQAVSDTDAVSSLAGEFASFYRLVRFGVSNNQVSVTLSVHGWFPIILQGGVYIGNHF